MGLRDWLPFGKGKGEESKDYDKRAGVGKIGGDPAPVQQIKPSARKVDTEAQQILNEATLAQLGVSKEMIELVRKHKDVININALEQMMDELNRDLEYAGFEPITSAEEMIRTIIGHKLLEQTREKQFKDLIKQSHTKKPQDSVEWKMALDREAKLRSPLTLQEALLMMRAESRIEKGSEAITDADLDHAVLQLKRQAHHKKAVRLAKAEVQFLLKKSRAEDYKPANDFATRICVLRETYGDKIPIEDLTQITKDIYTDYMNKHPFRG